MATGGPNGRYRPPSSPSLIDQNDSRGAHSSSLPSYRLTVRIFLTYMTLKEEKRKTNLI